MSFVPSITLSQAMTDPQLFGDVFAAPSFWTWRTVAKVVDGEELVEPREIELYEQCTGRPYDRNERHRLRRLIALCGRRAGKDRFFSALAVWRAALCADWRRYISPGEQAVVILLGGDRKQANILSRYCTGLLTKPMLAAEVKRQTNEVIEFKNGASLEIATNDARLVRGRSAIAVLGSEVCHWQTAEHSASSDEEVVGAAEPSLSMAPDGGLMCLWSSVHRKRGYAYRKYKQALGNADGDDLVWFAPSATMNPKLPISVIDRALAEDGPRARAEYQNVWRDDLSDFVRLDVIEAATDVGVYERAPLPYTTYYAHADCAGGTGTDSFALAICHKEASYVIDSVREYKPRFVPAQVIAELAVLLKTYNIDRVFGDRYAIGFHSSEWQSHGIEFVPCENSTSENYLTTLPLLLAGRVRLVDNVTLRNQFTSLERRPGDLARELVSHPVSANAHDDVACAVAGAIFAATSVKGFDLSLLMADNGDDGKAKAEYELWRRLREEEERNTFERDRSTWPKNVYPYYRLS